MLQNVSSNYKNQPKFGMAFEFNEKTEKNLLKCTPSAIKKIIELTSDKVSLNKAAGVMPVEMKIISTKDSNNPTLKIKGLIPYAGIGTLLKVAFKKVLPESTVKLDELTPTKLLSFVSNQANIVKDHYPAEYLHAEKLELVKELKK